VICTPGFIVWLNCLIVLNLRWELEGQMTTQNLIHRSYNKLRDAGSYVVYCCYSSSSSSHIGVYPVFTVRCARKTMIRVREVYCCYYLSWCNSLCVPLEKKILLMMHCL
jgi:hypothetical protein